MALLATMWSPSWQEQCQELQLAGNDGELAAVNTRTSFLSCNVAEGEKGAQGHAARKGPSQGGTPAEWLEPMWPR